MYESTPYFYGTGRRKSSVARVRVYAGTGKITINERDIDDYFGLETLKLIVRQPLALTGTAEKFDIVCRVGGGGVTGQAGAIRHGISRALLQYDEALRPALKKAGLLTRDPRMKERNTVSKAPVALRSSQRDKNTAFSAPGWEPIFYGRKHLKCLKDTRNRVFVCLDEIEIYGIFCKTTEFLIDWSAGSVNGIFLSGYIYFQSDCDTISANLAVILKAYNRIITLTIREI